MEHDIPEDEEEQLKLAIAMSLEVAEAEEPATASQEAHAPQASRMFGLDRKAMEKERLARLQARMKTDTSSEITRKRAADVPIDLTSERDSSYDSSASNKRAKLESSKKQQDLRFARGAVMKTWCRGFERTPQDIKIEELLDKDNLRLAVLSSFQWDVEWILSKLNPSTKLVFVMQAKDHETREQYRRETATSSTLRLCFPPMPGYVNCMHSKLMLLSFSTHLRVVIPSANLVSYDWGESGTMENCAYIHDFPRRYDGGGSEPDKLPVFGQELTYFCRAMGLDEDIVRSIGKFDFSGTDHLALVHTIGGEHKDDWKRTGYPGLGQAVSRLGLATASQVAIDFVASSIGAIDQAMVRRICLACKGDDGSTELEERTSRKPRQESDASNKPDLELSVYFPSQATVERSKGGPNHAGTLCFQERWFNSPNFPKSILRDCTSVRPGLLMHNKMIFVKPAGMPNSSLKSVSSRENERSLNDALAGAEMGKYQGTWVYVGSANFSESAWGRLVQDRASKRPKLTCRNWECGVVIRCGHEDVPVPMSRPGAVLGERGLKPWFYTGV